MSTQPPYPVPARLSRRGLIAGAAAIPAAALLPASPAAAQTTYASYLMAHFIGEGAGGEQIYLSHSDNGLNWTDLNRGQIVLRTPLGTKGVRDPSIIRNPAGNRYWMSPPTSTSDLGPPGATPATTAAATSSSGSPPTSSTGRSRGSSRRRLHRRRRGRLGSRGDLGRRGRELPALLGHQLDPERHQEAPHLERPHHRLPLHHHAADVHRTSPAPKRSSTPRSSRPDTGGYRYYRASKTSQIHLRAATPSPARGPAWATWRTSPGSGVEGPMWAKFNDRNEWALWLDGPRGLHARPHHQPRVGLRLPHHLRLQPRNESQVPRLHPQPHLGRADPGARPLPGPGVQPAPVLQLPGPLCAPLQHGRAHRPQVSPAETPSSGSCRAWPPPAPSPSSP